MAAVIYERSIRGWQQKEASVGVSEFKGLPDASADTRQEVAAPAVTHRLRS